MDDRHAPDPQDLLDLFTIQELEPRQATSPTDGRGSGGSGGMGSGHIHHHHHHIGSGGGSGGGSGT